MAIHYDITQVKNWEKVCYNIVNEKELALEKKYEEENGKRNKIIELARFEEKGKTFEMSAVTWNLQFMMALNLGIGEITENNYPQVHARIELYETLMGCNIGGKFDKGTTIEQVKEHIGMKVNANIKTPSQFVKSVVGMWKRTTNNTL